MLPVTEDAQTAELPPLDVDELVGIFLGLLTHLQGGEPCRGLHHAELDRQTVTIPSGNERGLESGHGLRLHHQILEHLVESRPHMDISIGERRAIVEDELRSPLSGLLDCSVETLPLPSCQQLGFTLRKTGFHREGGFGKSDGILVAAHDGKIMKSEG